MGCAGEGCEFGEVEKHEEKTHPHKPRVGHPQNQERQNPHPLQKTQRVPHPRVPTGKDGVWGTQAKTTVAHQKKAPVEKPHGRYNTASLFAGEVEDHWGVFAVGAPGPGFGDVVGIVEAENEVMLVAGVG